MNRTRIYLLACVALTVICSTSLFRCGKSNSNAAAKPTISGSANSGKF